MQLDLVYINILLFKCALEELSYCLKKAHEQERDMC